MVTSNPFVFAYNSLPWSLVFKDGGLADLGAHAASLDFKRVMVITTPNQVRLGADALNVLEDRAAGSFGDAAMHVPAETVEAAAAHAKSIGADSTISIGGGSTTGLSKAIAVLYGLPYIAVPTSFAGSEMTNIYGITRGDKKETKRDIRAVPSLTLYDADLIASMPPAFAAASGMNAMAQAVVNIATDSFNPMVGAFAVEAVRAMSQALPKVVADPADSDARAQALLGACLAGASLGTGQTSLHHRLCHTFGGAMNTPHAETHAILLPHSVAYNSTAAAEGTARLADALGVSDASRGLYDLLGRLGLPSGMSALGVAPADVDRIADKALAQPLSNPEPVTKDALTALLHRAVAGDAPLAHI